MSKIIVLQKNKSPFTKRFRCGEEGHDWPESRKIAKKDEKKSFFGGGLKITDIDAEVWRTVAENMCPKKLFCKKTIVRYKKI